jgi:hypothetical protein
MLELAYSDSEHSSTGAAPVVLDTGGHPASPLARATAGEHPCPGPRSRVPAIARDPGRNMDALTAVARVSGMARWPPVCSMKGVAPVEHCSESLYANLIIGRYTSQSSCRSFTWRGRPPPPATGRVQSYCWRSACSDGASSASEATKPCPRPDTPLSDAAVLPATAGRARSFGRPAGARGAARPAATRGRRRACASAHRRAAPRQVRELVLPRTARLLASAWNPASRRQARAAAAVLQDAAAYVPPEDAALQARPALRRSPCPALSHGLLGVGRRTQAGGAGLAASDGRHGCPSEVSEPARVPAWTSKRCSILCLREGGGVWTRSRRRPGSGASGHHASRIGGYVG